MAGILYTVTNWAAYKSNSELIRSTRLTTAGIRTSTMETRTTTTRTTIVTLERPAIAHDFLVGAPVFEEVAQAYYDCRKNKRNKNGNAMFELDLTNNLNLLYNDLISGDYKIGQSVCFIVTYPKPREVWAADFRDRIVHHILYNRIAPQYIRSFSAASCACIPERGTLYGVKRLDKAIRRTSNNWNRKAYYLKMDLANFFMSIDKPTLKSMLFKRGYDDWTNWIIETIIDHDPTTNYRYNGNPDLIKFIPPHKSLIGNHPDKGLPIGNLSSQFFANVYMDVMDKLVDHFIKPSGYVRYVDDMLLIDADKNKLIAARDKIQSHAAEKLKARFNPTKTILQSVDRGVDFVGYVILPHRITPRRAILYKAKKAVIESPNRQARMQTTNSYLGILSHAKAKAHQATLCKLAYRLGHPIDRKLGKIYT